MVKTISAASIVLVVVSLILGEGVSIEQECPVCAFEVAYWISKELVNVSKCFKGPDQTERNAIFSSIDLLRNSTSSMLKNEKLDIRGDTGSTGAKGLPGPRGRSGAIGNTGWPGVPGVMGLIGVSGAFGNIGMQGAKGPPGVTGYRRTKRQNPVSTVRGKIVKFTKDCNFSSEYFLTNADEIDKLVTLKINAGNGAFQRLNARFNEIIKLYIRVKEAYTTKLNTVKKDPRFKGVIGGTGAYGVEGRRGYTGRLGRSGIYGDTGFTGATGLTGPTGGTGSTGLKGLSGLPLPPSGDGGSSGK